MNSVTPNNFVSCFENIAGKDGDCITMPFLSVPPPRFLSLSLSLSLSLCSYLAYNHIRKLTNSTFNGLEEVNVLQISDNQLNEIEGQPFQNLQKLSNLYLSNNQIDDTNLNFLGQLNELKSLDISDNRMSEFPDVSHIPLLTYVYADHNRLKAVRKDTFISNRHLRELHLNDNRGLEQIDRGAFRRKNRIKAVDLSFSGLRRLPNLETFPELYDLRLEHSRLTELPANICQIAPKLKFLYAYDNELEAIPDLSNCTELIHLELQYNRIREISEHSFKGLGSLETVRLYRNRIQSCHPNALRGLGYLEEFDLSHNRLEYLPPDLFRGLINLRRLELQYNKITNLPRNIFKDLKHLELLFANDNSIRTVGSEIFHPNMSWLHNLSLSNNPEMPRLPLPPHGFPFLGSLEMANLPLIYNVPTVEDIPRIQTIEFTYSYHCCLFKDYAPPRRLALQESKDTGDSEILFSFRNTPAEEITLPPDISDSLLFQGIDPFNHKIQGISPQEFIDGLLEYQKLYNVTLIPYENGEVVAIANRDKSVVGRLKDEESKYLRNILPSFFVSRDVYCTPLPSSLTPCDNLLDPQPLPVLVWIIWFTAVIANLAVLFVMIVSKEKLEVHHFFICNLAFADFLLGVYLAFLGTVDIRTRGKGFYKSALTWQNGPGCQTAGFIAIFASELSVFVLTVMTLERLHTIAYSFKSGRLKLRNAAIIVLVCWVMAGVLASLPIFDINSYSEVAICLPFKLSSVRDKLFIALIPTLNLTAFFIILASYLHILRLFCRSPANTGDNGNKREKIVVSFKMGVLVLTNLACWLPLATVGYAAVADQHIIDFVEAKFFIILIFPINACLNPFIYSIFTKQFLSRARGLCHRKDKMQHVSNNHSFYRLSFRRNSIASAASDTCSSTLRTNSPRCDIDFDLLTRRQSRRSFSVQLASPPLAQPVVSVVSPGPHMGRRYSSPAIFANMDSSSLSLPPSLPPQVPGNEGRAAGLPELPRPHSKCLSIVQEESDESDSEEVGAALSANLRSRRRSSDPEVLSSSRVGGLKDLFGPRGDKVEDERTSLCAIPSYKSDSPPHRSSSPPLVNPGTVQSHGDTSSSRVSHVHSSDLVIRRLSPLTAHSIRIVNPHAAKVSKHCIQESQV